MIFIFVGSPTIQIPSWIFLFLSSLINIGAPKHAVSSSNVKEKWISLFKSTLEKTGANAKVHAINPFISQEPLP